MTARRALSAIAAQVHRNPKAIREMIHPEVTGGFRVVFGDGQKIEVAPLTDGELLLGSPFRSTNSTVFSPTSCTKPTGR